MLAAVLIFSKERPFKMKSEVSLQILVYKIKEVNHLRHTDINKTIYAQRKETIERVFVNQMKSMVCDGHFKRTKKMGMLTLATMNLKKMANWA
jgi:hypothetical protein